MPTLKPELFFKVCLIFQTAILIRTWQWTHSYSLPELQSDESHVAPVLSQEHTLPITEMSLEEVHHSLYLSNYSVKNSDVAMAVLGVRSTARLRRRAEIVQDFVQLQKKYYFVDDVHLVPNLPAASQVNSSLVVRSRKVLFAAMELQRMLEDVKWFLIIDDDTFVFEDNLLRALSDFNHLVPWYIGGVTESKRQAAKHGTSMAYGGAGIVLSQSLVQVLTRESSRCFSQIDPGEMSGDEFLWRCIRLVRPDIQLTNHRGFNQMDAFGDVSGLVEGHVSKSMPVTLHNMEVSLFLDPAPRFNVFRNFYLITHALPQRHMFQRFVAHEEITWVLSFGYTLLAIPNEIFAAQNILNHVERTWIGWDSKQYSDDEYFTDPGEISRPAITAAGKPAVRYTIQFGNATHQYYSVANPMLPNPVSNRFGSLPPWYLVHVIWVRDCTKSRLSSVLHGDLHGTLSLHLCPSDKTRTQIS